jgi:hypothetical protein
MQRSFAAGLAAALFLSSSPRPVAAQTPDRARLIELAAGALTPELASALELDVASRDGIFVPGAVNQVVARERDLAALDGLRVPYRVAVEDLEAHYAARLVPGGVQALGGYGAWLSPPFAQGGMGGYYTYAEIGAVLDQIHAAYPALTTAKASLGTSVEGRALWMIKVSDNPNADEGEPEARFDALHHAREPESMQATLWFLLALLEGYGSDPLATYLVDQRELFFVPCVNPDGYEYNRSTNPSGGGLWRKNRRNNGGGVYGVDLNRNYASFWGHDDLGSSPSTSSETYRGPSPASEPEVAAMQAFFAARDFQTALSTHTYSNLWLYPYGYDELLPANDGDYQEVTALATAVNHYLAGPSATTLYLANGVTTDHEHETHGTMSWTPEIGGDADGFWPPSDRIVPLAEENLVGFQVTALAAGPYVHADPVFDELGDGDGFYEAGESVAWPRLSNSGRAGSPPVTVTLASSSPWATVATPSFVSPPIAPFSAYASQSPVRLQISPSAPGGTQVDYTLSVSYSGWTQTAAGSFAVGELRPYLVDTLEEDHGWTAGLAGDTATTGKWVRGEPIGTSSSGEEVNPELDATPAPGADCFMTGNGGGSAGNDDVDGGVTTLLSPRFDLSGVQSARLSYQRWYALMTSLDDSFEIAISSDGGGSWTPLEAISAHENQWTRSSFDLGGLVPYTDRMQLRFQAGDLESGSLVEAAVDDLEVEVYDSGPRLHFYGPVAAGGSVELNVSGAAGARYFLQWSSGSELTAIGGAASGIQTWSWTPAGQPKPNAGTIPPSGLHQAPFAVPDLPGTTIHYRAITRSGGVFEVSNVAVLAIP